MYSLIFLKLLQGNAMVNIMDVMLSTKVMKEPERVKHGTSPWAKVQLMPPAKRDVLQSLHIPYKTSNFQLCEKTHSQKKKERTCCKAQSNYNCLLAKDSLAYKITTTIGKSAALPKRGRSSFEAHPCKTSAIPD